MLHERVKVIGRKNWDYDAEAMKWKKRCP